MKPQDVIKQLIGECSGWDQNDLLNFVFYQPSKFPDASCAYINFDEGSVVVQYCVYDADGEEDIVREDKFAIKATLEEIDNPGMVEEGDVKQL